MSTILDESQIQSALANLPGWKLEQGELVQTVTFKDFQQAMEFVNQVAKLSEDANHHPRYRHSLQQGAIGVSDS